MKSRRSSVHLSHSPSKRRNSILSPTADNNKRNSTCSTPENNADNVFMEVPENNDANEKRLRKLNRLQQLQGKGIGSPSVASADRRNSIGVVHSLTNQQLSEHYSKCLQLSTENKINVKNAFNLQLIDYMTEMLKRKDSDMKNFQMASLTLDASTKIYAYRVDSIHTDTLKIAGGLGRTQQDKEEKNEDAEDGLESAIRKKRKVKRTLKIEANLKNINISQFDVDYEVDPLFKKQTSISDENRASTGMFLTSLQMLHDSGQMILDSTTIITDQEPDTKTDDIQVPIPVFPDITNSVICPTFTPFKFSNWKVSDEDSFCDVTKVKKDEEEDHAFDMNAVPEPIEEDFPEPTYGVDDDIGEDDFAEADGTAITVGVGGCHQAAKHSAPPVLMETIQLKDHLANVPLEYSYFDTRVMSAWAGPGHWKLKPLSKEPSKGGITKEERKKKQNIVLQYIVSTDESDNPFEVTKRATKLSYNTVKQWNKEKSTLPLDLHYDINKFSKLYGRPDTLIRKLINRISTTNVEDNNDLENDDVMHHDDSHHAEDDMMEPGGFDIDQTQFPGNVTVFESQSFVNDKTTDFVGDNLVAAPTKVAKININYARTAKKMDMKKLKTQMWTILTDSSDDKENDKRNENKVTPMLSDSELDRTTMKEGYSTTFSRLYTDLQPKLTSKMAENLSIPLAFIGLLHLANEYNLKMESVEELGDFSIVQN